MMDIPDLYLLRNRLTPEETDAVEAALNISPIEVAVVTTPADGKIASRFTDKILSKFDISLEEAITSAQELIQTLDIKPIAVIGNFPYLLAVYEKEAVKVIDLHVDST